MLIAVHRYGIGHKGCKKQNAQNLTRFRAFVLNYSNKNYALNFRSLYVISLHDRIKTHSA